MSRRQDPVSCLLCRKKKLRCPREHPCSNCVARGVKCEREAGLPNSTSTPTAQEPPDARDLKCEVLARMQRLEELVHSLDAKITIRSSLPGISVLTQQTTPPDSLYTAANDNEIAHNTDTRLLEDIGTKDLSLLVRLSTDLQCYITNIHDIVSKADDASLPAPSNIIYLPCKTLAKSFLDVYHQNIEFLHHVTYRPHVCRTLDQVYAAIDTGNRPHPGAVALLLSIFASSAALQVAISPHDDILGISALEANALCTIWAKSLFDCLDHSRRLGTASIEELQASITSFFLMYNLEGFSGRSRSGMVLSLAIARDLGLHRLDHPDTRQPSQVGLDKVETEVRRRIWWHLAATDWQLSVSAGPQEGTYNVQPRQVATRPPRNINEEDLETQHKCFERPLEVPTDSSYLVQRIKLAEICRHITDAIPLGFSGADSARYDDILALDAEFEIFLDNLPPFFKMTPTSNDEFRVVYAQRPSTLIQKYVVNMIAQTRRCRLHQPYLIRGFTNSAYALSRDVCLQSARAVISIKHELDAQRATAASLLALSGAHHHMFFSTMALVMDLCFNKTKDDDATEKARKTEVMDALRILESAEDRSPVARRFLQSLMAVMRKHKVRLIDPAVSLMSCPGNTMSGGRTVPIHVQNPIPDAIITTSGMDDGRTYSEATYTNQKRFDSQNYDDIYDSTLLTDIQHQPSDFDEIWQSYIEHGPKFEVPEWDELFTDLQMQMT